MSTRGNAQLKGSQPIEKNYCYSVARTHQIPLTDKQPSMYPQMAVAISPICNISHTDGSNMRSSFPQTDNPVSFLAYKSAHNRLVLTAIAILFSG